MMNYLPTILALALADCCAIVSSDLVQTVATPPRDKRRHLPKHGSLAACIRPRERGRDLIYQDEHLKKLGLRVHQREVDGAMAFQLDDGSPITDELLQRAAQGQKERRIGKVRRLEEESEHAVVVIDNASDQIKAGFAGDEMPTLVFHSVYVKYVTSTELLEEIGDSALEVVDPCRVIYPNKNGVIEDFETMAKIWIYILRQLGVDSDVSLLMSEASVAEPDGEESRCA